MSAARGRGIERNSFRSSCFIFSEGTFGGFFVLVWDVLGGGFICLVAWGGVFVCVLLVL